MTGTMHSRHLVSVVSLLATAAAAQFPISPGPDILVGDNRLEGIYRGVDRDNDGFFDFTTGELYDYATPQAGVEFASIVQLGAWICAVRVAPIFAVPYVADAYGEFTININYPPALSGITWDWQAVEIAVGANPFGVSTTNAVRLHLVDYSLTLE